jgi:hypothetical protein
MTTPYWLAIVAVTAVVAFVAGLAAEYLSTGDLGPWKCVLP